MVINNRVLFLLGLGIAGFLIRNEYNFQEIKNETQAINHRLETVEQIINTTDKIKYTAKDLNCMAKNIYYEAGIEKDIGKYAIAHVTLNRVKAGFWGNNICKVVYAKHQFSWTKKQRLHKPDVGLLKHCQEIARAAFEGRRVRGLDKSLFYHADYIKIPLWVDHNERVAQIGQHIFYNKAKGSWLEL